MNRQEPLAAAAATGLAVGLTDVALVFPLAVLATRRECGLSLRTAIGQGKFWAGGLTAATLLIPYSIAVEAVSTLLNGGGAGGAGIAAVGGTTLVTTLGVQPIEKKLVIDQMLQTPRSETPTATLFKPFREISAYTRANGVRALFGGFWPLLGREFCYISAITAVNPVVTAHLAADGHVSRGVAGAFAVGAAAGIVSAPLQTLSAMQKSETHRGDTVRVLLQRHIFGVGGLPSGINRLFFGAATRSCRTGCAGVLYYGWRKVLRDGGTGSITL